VLIVLKLITYGSCKCYFFFFINYDRLETNSCDWLNQLPHGFHIWRHQVTMVSIKFCTIMAITYRISGGTRWTGTAYNTSGAPEFTLGFSGVRIAQSLVFAAVFLEHCLSFCTFSLGHCVVCPSSIYVF
jgi:hypothetical protein